MVFLHPFVPRGKEVSLLHIPKANVYLLFPACLWSPLSEALPNTPSKTMLCLRHTSHLLAFLFSADDLNEVNSNALIYDTE